MIIRKLWKKFHQKLIRKSLNLVFITSFICAGIILLFLQIKSMKKLADIFLSSSSESEQVVSMGELEGKVTNGSFLTQTACLVKGREREKLRLAWKMLKVCNFSSPHSPNNTTAVSASPLTNTSF